MPCSRNGIPTPSEPPRGPEASVLPSVRAATPRDLPRLLDFIRELAAFAGCPAPVQATEEKLGRLLFGDGARCEALLADLGGTTVGYAFFFETYSSFLASPCLWLEDLYVVPRARGRGAGSALLRHLAAIARERECARIDWLVAATNGRGINFYQGQGASLQLGEHLCRADRQAIDRLGTAS